MVENQLQQLLSLLNDQTDTQEDLNEQLTKASALAALTLSENFLDHSKSTIRSCLWLLSDVIEQAKTLGEQNLDALMKGTPVSVNAYTETSHQT